MNCLPSLKLYSTELVHSPPKSYRHEKFSLFTSLIGVRTFCCTTKLFLLEGLSGIWKMPQSRLAPILVFRRRKLARITRIRCLANNIFLTFTYALICNPTETGDGNKARHCRNYSPTNESPNRHFATRFLRAIPRLSY